MFQGRSLSITVPSQRWQCPQSMGGCSLPTKRTADGQDVRIRATPRGGDNTLCVPQNGWLVFFLFFL